ncbi:MAG: PEP-CTERM sorting domain-containing protein [Verrucomicrobia bacterium]|nr:PEP-CTERM sorting domain-containing protein [Verrucomicrobiota bacterium]MBI3870654.1 PEP-CTERM sorting domain-containing protein [Verrucomicrobiota bacterium]
MRTFVFCCALLFSGEVMQAVTLEVESLYDNHGTFQFSMKAGDGLTWNFPVSGGFITMKLPGTLELITPEGWAGIVDEDDMVTWTAKSSLQVIGSDPVVFGVKSASTELARYGRYVDGKLLDPAYPAGAMAAFAIVPEPASPVLGYLGFTYVGPAAMVPEPGVVGLSVLGGLLLLRRCRR